MTTMSFHYIALLSFYLRSFRIQQVMTYYKRYILILERKNTKLFQGEDGLQAIFQQHQISDSAKFKEKHLIRLLGLLAFFLTFLGVLSFVFQPLFAIIPVYESQQCYRWFDCPQGTLCIIPDECGVHISQSMFFVFFNWLELVGFFWAYWSIRRIQEAVNIRKEMLVTMLCYITTSLIYFTLANVEF